MNEREMSVTGTPAAGSGGIDVGDEEEELPVGLLRLNLLQDALQISHLRVHHL